MLIIKEIAKRKGVSLEELAEKLGINRVTLSRNINGNPTVKTLETIAEALEVEVRDLFEGKSSETIYIKREGQFVPVGKLERSSLDNGF